MWRLVWLLSCGLGGALRPAEPSRAGAALLTAGTASFPVPDGLLFDRLPMSQVEQALGRVAAHLKLIFLPELVTMMLFMLTLLCATACGKWLDEEPAEGPDGRRRRRRTFIIVEGNEVAYDSQALARRLQAEEQASHELPSGDATVGGIPPQVLSDERLARLLQEQSPTTVAESPVEASHQATAIHAYVHEDEELARLLQAEEDDTRTASHSTAPPRRRHGHDPRGGTSAWPLLLSVLSSGACFGGCAGLQMAASFNCGQTALWICSLGGAVVGHLASNDTVPFQGRVHQAQEPRDSDSDSEDDSFCRGLDHEVIEGHTIGHTFHSTSTGRREAGNVEHLKCMVCMEEFVEGDTLRSLPCLHRYHQHCIDQWLARSAECPICKQNITAPQRVQPANTAATGNGLTRMLRWR